MKVMSMEQVSKEPVTNPLFTGGPVTRQPLVTREMGNNMTANVVNFSKGAKNKLHMHTSDQVLIVTAGTGIVATEQEERTVGVGEVIHFPAGEKHWHGATKESEFSHIAITAVGSETTQLES
ncbi:cupin domain-containing protein [Chloroflexota bacterium]